MLEFVDRFEVEAGGLVVAEQQSPLFQGVAGRAASTSSMMRAPPNERGRCSRSCPPFPVPTRRTGRTAFPHPALWEISCPHGRSRVLRVKRTDPIVSQSSLSGLRHPFREPLGVRCSSRGRATLRAGSRLVARDCRAGHRYRATAGCERIGGRAQPNRGPFDVNVRIGEVETIEHTRDNTGSATASSAPVPPGTFPDARRPTPGVLMPTGTRLSALRVMPPAKQLSATNRTVASFSVASRCPISLSTMRC